MNAKGEKEIWPSCAISSVHLLFCEKSRAGKQQKIDAFAYYSSIHPVTGEK
jgi:hypothetical protein